MFMYTLSVYNFLSDTFHTNAEYYCVPMVNTNLLCATSSIVFKYKMSNMPSSVHLETRRVPATLDIRAASREVRAGRPSRDSLARLRDAFFEENLHAVDVIVCAKNRVQLLLRRLAENTLRSLTGLEYLKRVYNVGDGDCGVSCFPLLKLVWVDDGDEFDG